MRFWQVVLLLEDASKTPKSQRSHDHMGGALVLHLHLEKPKVTNELRDLAGWSRLFTKLKASSIGCSG
jgi:hypothetical protein